MSNNPDQSCDGCRSLSARVSRIERTVYGTAYTQDSDSPVARGISDLVTPRQLANIRREANAAGLNAEAECVRLHGCATSDLTRAAADKLITSLAAHARASQGGRG